MAKDGNDSGGSSGGWPGLLAELTKSFLILRDIFGYALPGAVFLAIGWLNHRFSLHDVKSLFDPYPVPLWVAIVLALGACYVIGHLMAGIAYLPFNTWKVPFINAGKNGLTQVPSALIAIRASHPELLTELERQSTMTQLRGSTGAAMVLGYLIFYRYSTPSLGWMVGIAGLFLLIIFWLSASPHILNLKASTADAAKAVDEANKPATTVDPATLKQVLEQFIAAAQDALRKL